MKKRILMLVDGLPTGSAEKAVLTLASGLAALGHHVAIFSLRSVCHYTLPEGVVYQVITDKHRSSWLNINESKRRAQHLDEIISRTQKFEGDYDLVISHLYNSDKIVARCRSLDQNKVWFCLHEMLSISSDLSRSGYSGRINKKSIQRVYQQRNIIAVSQSILDDIKQTYEIEPSRSAIIGNPYNIAEIQNQMNEPFTPPEEAYLLHVGGLDQNKRHDRLLEAYALSGVTLPLVLLGESETAQLGTLKAQAQTLGIEDRIIFQGYCANPYPWMRKAKALVQSVDTEGFGDAALEAMLCGTPVVSTRSATGTVALLKGDLERGLAEANAPALAEKIREVVTNPPDVSAVDFSQFETQKVCQQYLALN